MADLKEILVVGGTGAQGMPAVKVLAESGRYRVRVLTRSIESSRAKQLAALQNTASKTCTRRSEASTAPGLTRTALPWERRTSSSTASGPEIARAEGVQHYVWANIEYALGIAGFDEEYHCGYVDSKGRIGKFILAQGQEGMKSFLLITGPYIDMLMDGMFVPTEQADGSFLWANPAKDGKPPLIALDDVGIYSRWLFDNPPESAGLDLSVTTDEVSFDDIARTFTKATGKPGVHESVPIEAYAAMAEPYPGASVNWVLGPDAAQDDSVMT